MMQDAYGRTLFEVIRESKIRGYNEIKRSGFLTAKELVCGVLAYNIFGAIALILGMAVGQA